MKNDAKNWLVVSVFFNAILGGVLASIVFDSEIIGIIIMIAVFIFAVIMTTIANRP